MELYDFYDTMFTVFFTLKGKMEIGTVVVMLSVSVAVGLTLFILQGVGLYTMAKRRALKRKWWAFVPFVNFLLMEKLAGDCIIFGRRMKRAGLYAMIAQIVAFLFACSYAAAETVMFVQYGEYLEVTETAYGTIMSWGDLPVQALPLYNFLKLGSGIVDIFSLVYRILLLVLVISVYRKYAPRQAMLLSFLVFFVPEARCIVAFVLRNKQPIDYEEYMRRQREEYMRRQGGGYGPYGYGQGGYQPPQPPRTPEDPFSEFGNGKEGEKKSGECGETSQGGSDDLFD